MSVEPVGSPWAGLHKRTPGTTRRPRSEFAPIAVVERDPMSNAPTRLAVGGRVKPVAIPMVYEGGAIGTVAPDGAVSWRDCSKALSAPAQHAAIAKAALAVDRGHARGVYDDDGTVRAIRVT